MNYIYTNMTRHFLLKYITSPRSRWIMVSKNIKKTHLKTNIIQPFIFFFYNMPRNENKDRNKYKSFRK